MSCRLMIMTVRLVAERLGYSRSGVVHHAAKPGILQIRAPGNIPKENRLDCVRCRVRP